MKLCTSSDAPASGPVPHLRRGRCRRVSMLRAGFGDTSPRGSEKVRRQDVSGPSSLFSAPAVDVEKAQRLTTRQRTVLSRSATKEANEGVAAQAGKLRRQAVRHVNSPQQRTCVDSAGKLCWMRGLDIKSVVAQPSGSRRTRLEKTKNVGQRNSQQPILGTETCLGFTIRKKKECKWWCWFQSWQSTAWTRH